MIVLAQFYARYNSTIEDSQITAAGERLFTFVDETVRDFYRDRFNEYRLSPEVRIEGGSTKTWVTVGALITILNQYGSIRESADYLIKDTAVLSRLIIPAISRVLGLPDPVPEYHQRRLGVPGRLRRLFEQVEQGEISATEAVDRARRLLEAGDGPDLADLPQFKEQVAKEFHQIEQSLSASHHMPSDAGTVHPPVHVPRDQTLPVRRDPVVAPVPGTKFRRRRKGVIARRSSATGNLEIYEY